MKPPRMAQHCDLVVLRARYRTRGFVAMYYHRTALFSVTLPLNAAQMSLHVKKLQPRSKTCSKIGAETCLDALAPKASMYHVIYHVKFT